MTRAFELIIDGQMKNRTKIYTVSQVNSLIKGILGSNLPGQMTVSGEISGWKGAHSSGICYFSLKDEGAVLPCVMWPDKFAKVKFRPENGLAIFGTGYISVYELQGKYQFYIESMEPAGKGALWLAYEQTKNRLAEEGLFDKAHKKPLPPYPERIGILTSESGAAVRDIEKSIFDRWSCVLCLYPVPVQGEGAAAEIAAGIRDINRRNKKLRLDILIVGRGGGSMEDLWAFNEEVLARAIFDSKIPVISAVGHEVDVTIADFVADARASTPTKAGVIAVPDIKEVLEQIDSAYKRIRLNTVSTLKLSAQKLETILAATMFRSPLVIIQNREQMLDELESGLAESAKSLVLNIQKILQSYFEQILKIEPYRILADRKILLNNVSSRINERIGWVFANLKIRFETQAAKLSACNPKSILNRGYSIAKNTITGKVVTSPADVNIGDLLITELKSENLIESRVTKK